MYMSVYHHAYDFLPNVSPCVRISDSNHACPNMDKPIESEEWHEMMEYMKPSTGSGIADFTADLLPSGWLLKICNLCFRK